MRVPLLALGLLIVSLPTLAADEALLPDGRKLTGELRWQDGRLRFAAKERTLLAADLHQVRCAAQEPTLLAGVVHRVTLCDRQQLTGELLGLDADTLRLQPAWSKAPLDVPRACVLEVANLAGSVPVFDDDFLTGAKAWKLDGNPTVSKAELRQGPRGLLFDTAGQSAGYSELKNDLIEAGSFGVNFYDPGHRDAGRWFLEAGFRSTFGPRQLEVTLAGDTNHYVVVFPDVREKPKSVLRQQGWHRLTMRFTANSFALIIDDRCLLESEEASPGGLFSYLCLGCTTLPGQTKVSGKMWFDQASIARSVGPLRPPARDPSQDEVWLVSGDQLFGQLHRADRKTIDLEGRFGRRSLTWSEVRSLRLRNATCPLQITDGEHVRLQLAAGIGVAADEIEGVLRKLDRDALVLQHAVGEVTIPRERVRQLQATFHGRRMELDNQAHHLGREVRAAFAIAQPEGLSLQRKFTLKDVPDSARLAVEVAHLQGRGDGPAIAQALQRGGLRTAVLLNGREIDYLNRLGERSSAERCRLRLPLPREALRVGENVLELRQMLDRQTGQYEDCMIYGITLETPR
jgi:hypothetical protein